MIQIKKKMGKQEDTELASLMNTSNTHLHEEQFSLKTNWRLAERRHTTQGI